MENLIRHCKTSDLVLHGLSLSHKKDAGLRTLGLYGLIQPPVFFLLYQECCQCSLRFDQLFFILCATMTGAAVSFLGRGIPPGFALPIAIVAKCEEIKNLAQKIVIWRQLLAKEKSLAKIFV